MQCSASTRPRLIITADDFGRDGVSTEAIARQLAAGTVTAASLMANGACFDQAVELIRAFDLGNCVGVHLTLDEGFPLSRKMRTFADPGGHLCVRRTLTPLSSCMAAAVEAELSAQIERVLSIGLAPTHLDSHRHIHTALPIGRIVVRLAQKYGVAYVRPARNLASRSWIQSGYKWLFNRYLASKVDTASRFGDVTDLISLARSSADTGITECMVHLDETPRGIRDRSLLESDEFRRILDRFEVVGHRDLH